jgi:hypothetical protein
VSQVYGSAKEWHTISLASNDLWDMATAAGDAGDDTLATMFETVALAIDMLFHKTEYEDSTGGRTHPELEED